MKDDIAQALVDLAKALVADEDGGVEEVEEVEPQDSKPVKERKKEAGRTAKEFQKNIDAISDVQAFIEDEAVWFNAFADKVTQTNLKRASKYLASARAELYQAWDHRDKTEPI